VTHDWTDPVVAPSARRHGVPPADAVHAYRNAIRHWIMEDGIVMTVGADQAGRFLEVAHVTDTEGRPVIIHAMPARRKFLG
jgi:hypothetical protein